MGNWKALSDGFNAGLKSFNTIENYNDKKDAEKAKLLLNIASRKEKAKQAKLTAQLTAEKIKNTQLSVQAKTKAMDKEHIQKGWENYAVSGDFTELNKVTSNYGGLNGASGFTYATDDVINAYASNINSGFTADNKAQYEKAKAELQQYINLTPQELASKDMPADVKDFAIQVQTHKGMQKPVIVSMQDGTYNVVNPIDVMLKFDIPSRIKARKDRLDAEKAKADLEQKIQLETSKASDPRIKQMNQDKANFDINNKVNEKHALNVQDKIDKQVTADENIDKSWERVKTMQPYISGKENIFNGKLDDKTLYTIEA